MDWNVQRVQSLVLVYAQKQAAYGTVLKGMQHFKKLFLLLLQISATNEALQVLNDASEDLSRGLKRPSGTPETFWKGTYIIVFQEAICWFPIIY